MMLLHVTIPNDEIARQRGYIYAALVVEENQVYIGQTRAEHGALGRLSQHLAFNPPGTLRKRVHEILATEISSLGAVEFAAVRLSDKPHFHERAHDYREAIEAICMYSLIERVMSADFSVGIIPRVRYGPYRDNPDVVAEAERVSSEILKWLKSTVRTDST
jgi:hypothetical protein